MLVERVDVVRVEEVLAAFWRGRRARGLGAIWRMLGRDGARLSRMRASWRGFAVVRGERRVKRRKAWCISGGAIVASVCSVGCWLEDARSRVPADNVIDGYALDESWEIEL